MLGFLLERSFHVLSGARGRRTTCLRLLLIRDLRLQEKDGRARRRVQVKPYWDVRLGLSWCPPGTAGQRWGRSPSASPPATVCGPKKEATSLKRRGQNKWLNLKNAHLTWEKEPISLRSNAMMTTETKEEKLSTQRLF